MSAGGQQFSFGSGYIYGVPLTGTNLTPVLLGTLQDVSYDISASNKELYGQFQFPVATGRGPAKFTGKAKMGAFSSQMWNTFFFGPGLTGLAAPTTVGAIQTVNGENGTPSTHVYTFANTASGTFDVDLGVVYGPGAATASQGLRLTKVASAPAIGQYSVVVATGAYTFNTSDTNANATNGVTISYTWLPTAPTQLIQAIYNSDFPLGSAPTFEIVHSIPSTVGGAASAVTLKIYAAIASKLSFGFKNTDFTVPDIDFSMFANAQGRVMDIITSS
jgi:hypothetical protein